MKIILKWVICVAALFLAQYIFPDQVQSDSMWDLLATGTVLWLVNICLRPIIKLLTLPITFLTLGLFSFVVNALMVKIAALVVPGMTIDGFLVCFIIALLVSVMNVILVGKKS